MAVEPRTSPLRAGAASRPGTWPRLTYGGTSGNERLTAATGLVLIVLLAVLGVTILRLHGPLLWLHLFLGLALIGPLALKMASTGYRFARYYLGDSAYRVKGPPPAALRMLAPAVVLSTVIVFASGVALLFTGPAERSTLLPIHKVSFIAWLVFMGLHVLGHLLDLPAPLRADWARGAELGGGIGGRAGRGIALGAALVAGVLLATLLIGEFAPWMHWSATFHHQDH
jgi:hypothetical protein